MNFQIFCKVHSQTMAILGGGVIKEKYQDTIYLQDSERDIKISKQNQTDSVLK